MSDQGLEVIDARLERISAICEQTATNVRDTSQTIKALSQAVDALTYQVGVMTTGLMDIKLTCERQEQNITRLVGIVERLIQDKLDPGQTMGKARQ